METHITIQVQCVKPSWIGYEKNNNYRLYVNDDLVTERTWLWDINTVIEENIHLAVDPGTAVTLRLDPILSPNSVAQFGLRVLKVNGWPRPDFGGESMHLSFAI